MESQQFNLEVRSSAHKNHKENLTISGHLIKSSFQPIPSLSVYRDRNKQQLTVNEMISSFGTQLRSKDELLKIPEIAVQ
jgi:hypothetical protein